jgi:hypothetical protein
MNSLTTVMQTLQAEMTAYANRPTKIQATKLRKALMLVNKATSNARKEVLVEGKDKTKKKVVIPEVKVEEVKAPEVKVEEVKVQEVLQVKEERLDPMTTSMELPPPSLLKRQKTNKHKKSKKSVE